MTTYSRQSYLDLIAQQIEANSADADELMVQRCYEAPGIAELVRGFMSACGQPLKRDANARGLALAIEQAVFAAIEKSAGEMAEIEAMQSPDPDDPYDDPAQIAADGNAMLDLQGARRS